MAFKFTDRYQKENLSGVLIVDALNLSFRWKHTQKYKDFKEEFVRTIESIANSYKCGKIIVAADWGSSSFRKNLFPEYKADRKERFKDQTEEEKKEFEEFFTEYEAALDLCNKHHIVLRYKNVEADDIAAHIVKCKKQYELNEIWLLSSDADWDLLIEEGVNRFSWRTRKEITVNNWSEHYDITKEEFLTYKCLMGDKSDNIPGISGIGPIRAAEIIKNYGTIFDIIDMLPIESKYRYVQQLNDGAKQLLSNIELMDLITYCDEAIGEENLQDIRAKLGDMPW